MKHLYFVRHGQSEANAAGVWSGSTNHQLTPIGHEQAKQAGKKAREQGLVFDIVISSPLDRAHHTAQHISREVGYPIENILLHPDLVERHFGVLENSVDTEASKAYFEDEASMDAYSDAERLVDMQWRAQKVVDYLNSLPHDTVLVVAHGSFGRALRRAIDKTPLNERGRSIDNAEMVKFI